MRSVSNFFKDIISILSKQGSQGALGEAIARRVNIPPGAAQGIKTEVDLTGVPGAKKTTRYIDNFIFIHQIIGEIKLGDSFDLDQFKDYLSIWRNKRALKANGRFSPSEIVGDIDGISYFFLPGKNDFRDNTDMKAKAQDRFSDMFKLLNEEEISNFSIYYMDQNGHIYMINEKILNNPKRLKSF